MAMYGPLAKAIDMYSQEYRELTPRRDAIKDPDVRRKLEIKYADIVQAQDDLIADVKAGRFGSDE